jgi:hypothetical protein
MNATATENERFWPMAGSALLLVEAILVGIGLAYPAALAAGADADDAARASLERSFAYAALGASLAGAAALAVGMLDRRTASWAWGFAALPIVYVVLQSVPRAVSGEVRAVAAFAAAAGAAVVWAFVLRRLTARAQYVTCVGALVVVGLFFRLWEPPPPKPLPIRQSLVEHFPRQLAGWSGEVRMLDKNTETELGADQYLNLALRLPDGREGMAFITYNASAWSNIPHVPWVCMVQSGYVKKQAEEREIPIERFPGQPQKEIPVNVLLFEPKPGLQSPPALMLQYFNVGGTYTASREWARVLGTRGSFTHRGSYLSQTQVAVWLRPGDAADPMSRGSEAYRLAVSLLNEVVPLLETEYYPKPESPGG